MPASHGHPFAPASRPSWEQAPVVSAQDCARAFDATLPYTMGVEEELMLVSAETLELAPAVERVLAGAAGDPRLQRELRAAQVEIVTPVCVCASDLRAHLVGARRRLVAAAGDSLRIAGAGTHPFSTRWGEIAEGERHRLLADDYAWAAKRTLACGLHVHVALGDADRALAVFNAIRSYVPEIGALAANSPFSEGRDTGFASIRPKLNEAFPREGVPPAFAAWDEFTDLVEWGRVGGAFPDATFLWWDVRPHPALGTVEVRVADTQTSVDDAVAIAAFVQSLASWLGHRHDAGDELRVHETFRISENLWSALRYGLSGWLVDLDTGERIPMRERVAALLDELEPFAEGLRAADELTHARSLVGGNGAERQRYVAERDGLEGLVRWLARQTDPR